MEFRKFLDILSRYKYFLSLICFSAIVTAVLLTYVVSEKYRSSTNVLIRPQKSITIVPKKEEILNFPVSYYTPVDTASKTYSEIIRSRVISEKIVKKLRLDEVKIDEKSGFRYIWNKMKNNVKQFIVKSWTIMKYGRIPEEDAFSSAVGDVMKNLSVKPMRETYMFELEAESKSPVLAAAIANTAAQEFVDYLEEMSSLENEKAKKTSLEKIKISEQKWDAARRAVVQYKNEHGIVSLKKEMELELELLSGLVDSRESTNTKIAGVVARKRELERQIAAQEKYSKSASKVTENPLVRELYSLLTRHEVKLAGLRKRYTPKHRAVEALQAEIEEIKNKLRDEAPTLHSEETLSVPRVYQELLSELARVETDMETLRAQKARLDIAILEKKALIEVMPSKEAELSSLELAENLSKETHILLSKEYEELVIMASRNTPDIKVINSAPVPAFPARPIKIYHAGLAGVLSLIAGIGIILLMENMNITIRSVEEAEKSMGLPVVMTIPHLDDIEGSSRPLITFNGKTPLNDKRDHKRISIQYPITVLRESDSAEGRGISGDIGSGGMCCYVNTGLNLEPGSAVDITVDVNGKADDKLTLKGSVLRSKKAFAGYHFSSVAVRFENMSDSMIEKAGKLVLENSVTSQYTPPPHFEESVRGLRSDVLYMNSQGVDSFLIASSGHAEGKSTVVANLAVSLAEINKKVLLIDGNLKSPSIHSIFGLSNESGLTDALSETTQPYLKKLDSGINVITAGKSVRDPSVLLGSYKMTELMNAFRKEFDIILIDSPPVLAGTDASLLAAHTHGTIVVVRSGDTTVHDVERLKQLLVKSHAKTLGIVLNGFKGGTGSYYAWS